MGKTRDLFKKIGDTKGTFYAEMGPVDRNSKDLTEAEEIKRWQEYTELYKKGLNDPANYNGVVTHLEPDFLECEVKWALGSITTNKAREVMEFQSSYTNPKRQCCWSAALNMSATQNWKRSVFIPVPKRGNARECSYCCTIVLISHASKVMLKSFKLGFSSIWTENFQIYKLDLEKAEEPEVILPTSIGSQKKEFQKNIYFIVYAKTFGCVDHNKLWKILQEIGIPDHLTCLLRNLFSGQEATGRTGHGTTDVFQIGKRVRQGCILSPCLFNLYTEHILWNAGLDES